MKKILVTAFDPFGGETLNPALEALKLLPDFISNANIHKLEIPTAFKLSGECLAHAIEKIKPDVVLSIGQAGGRASVTLERVAINVDDARIPDNLGKQPIDEFIQHDGETAYFSTLPIKRILHELLEKGIPAQVSNSAGTFVCNHLMYQGLYLADKFYPKMKVGFMHIPYLPEQTIKFPNQPSMSKEQILKAIEITIETVVERGLFEDLKMTGGTIC